MQILAYIKSFNIFRETKNKIEEEKKMETGKSLLASKVFYFNVLTGLLGVAATLSESPLAADPKVKAGFMAFVGIGNIILRLLTDQEISSVLPQKPV